MKLYVTENTVYTDRAMAEMNCIMGCIKTVNLTHVGKYVYVLAKAKFYCGLSFQASEVVKVFSNLRSAVHSNEWKNVVKTASDVYEYHDDVLYMCVYNDEDVWYKIIRARVIKDSYFDKKNYGPHTRLITSGIVDSRVINYTERNHRHTEQAHRYGNHDKRSVYIFEIYVRETEYGYIIYDGDRKRCMLPPDISYMGLIREVGSIYGGITINGWH